MFTTGVLVEYSHTLNIQSCVFNLLYSTMCLREDSDGGGEEGGGIDGVELAEIKEYWILVCNL